ncbi:MAG TPA: hypothetical protein VLW06_10510 [Terriglobales bacterium]|nr:hypothetical protein [Terriglobales bacterium]
MKAIAILVLASLPVPQVQFSRSASQPQPHFVQQAAITPHKGGQWYFARTGHAVYCYGPVMTLPNRQGEIERVATFCRGDRLLVPLKD